MGVPAFDYNHRRKRNYIDFFNSLGQKYYWKIDIYYIIGHVIKTECILRHLKFSGFLNN